MNPVTISPARQIAFEVLRRVEEESSYASDLLHARLSAKQIRQDDTALATELTLGVLRWQRRLDYEIDAHLRHKKLEAPVRVALRLGAYQILFLDRIPDHAAVNESVELVKRTGRRTAVGLVNAVLRKLVPLKGKRGGAAQPYSKSSAAERLGILASHPTWLVERWMTRWGEDQTGALLDVNNRAAPASFTCLASSREIFILKLGDQVEGGVWLTRAFRLNNKPAAHLPELDAALASGMVTHQDEASQMAALLLDVQPHDTVLDLCAAPGGKTTIISNAAGTGGRVIAADLHLHRLSALRQRLGKQGLSATLSQRAQEGLIALDATHPLPFSTTFSRIMVDAPCSGTGTLARNPEIRWRLKSADLAGLAAKQTAILQNALAALAPGGRLVYSTCSLEPEENERVVEAALANAEDCRICDGRPALRPHLEPGADVNQLFDSKGYFRTFPPKHQTDGFFAAVIEKKAR